MNHQDLIKHALSALEFIPESGSMLGTAAEAKRVEAVNLLRNVLAYPDKLDSPCPEFWDWLPLAYRDGDTGCSAKFTKYNMEVAFLAGKESAQTTTSQQWVGLTDEEMDELVDRSARYELVRAVEAKLKRKHG